MGNPYVGEIRLFAGNFAPAGWMLCQGQLLSIAENDVLFQLIGTTYGGDGQNTFQLPDLRGRVPLHAGQGSGLSNRTLGETGGQETVTVTSSQMPSHNHAPLASNLPGSQASPGGGYWAGSTSLLYSTGAPNQPINLPAVGNAGGNQPHENRIPFLGMNFIISLFGIFPSPS